jgi:hypothetical protein
MQSSAAQDLGTIRMLWSCDPESERPLPQFNGTGSVPVTVKEQTALQAAIANTTPALINSKVDSWNMRH